MSDIMSLGHGSLGLAYLQGWNIRNVRVVVETDKEDPSKPVVVVDMMQGFRRW